MKLEFFVQMSTRQLTILALVVLPTIVPPIDLLIERQVADGKRVSLYQESSVESTPVTSTEWRPGSFTISGGDRHTDVFGVTFGSLDATVPCRIVWMGSDVVTLRAVPNQATLGGERRFRVFDVSAHDGLVWVLYSRQGDVKIDVVEPTETSGKTIETLPLFKQEVPNRTEGRLVNTGQFIQRDGELLVSLELSGRDRRNEQWRVTKDSTVQIVDRPISQSQPVSK